MTFLPPVCMCQLIDLFSNIPLFAPPIFIHHQLAPRKGSPSVTFLVRTLRPLISFGVNSIQWNFLISVNAKAALIGSCENMQNSQCNPWLTNGLLNLLKPSLLYTERFSSGTPVFPSPQKQSYDLICVNLLISVYSVPN